MPSGKTHDRITLLLAPPTFACAWGVMRDAPLAAAVTGGLLFGGLMFGPDLDTQSEAYKRWGPLRPLWWPYKVIFKHRSRLSHGLLLGTAIRVAYFAGMVTLIVAAAMYIHNLYLLQRATTLGHELVEAAHGVGRWLMGADRTYLYALLTGTWWGAASHTLSDWAFTVWKQTVKML